MRTLRAQAVLSVLTLTAANLQIPGIDTMHAARISGGDVSNIISGGGGAVGYPADGDING